MTKEVVKSKTKLTVNEVAKNIPSWRDRDSELVSGIFKNLEAPGNPHTFNFKAYPGDDFKQWYFEDGEKYRIPRGLARHLNNDCFVKEYKHMPNEMGQFGIRTAAADGRAPGKDNMMAMKKVHRFAFHSLEFMDDDLDMVPAPDLTEVKYQTTV